MRYAPRRHLRARAGRVGMWTVQAGHRVERRLPQHRPHQLHLCLLLRTRLRGGRSGAHGKHRRLEHHHVPRPPLSYLYHHRLPQPWPEGGDPPKLSPRHPDQQPDSRRLRLALLHHRHGHEGRTHPQRLALQHPPLLPWRWYSRPCQQGLP